MMDGTKGFEDALTGEQKIRNFNINFGPQHPAAHGVRPATVAHALMTMKKIGCVFQITSHGIQPRARREITEDVGIIREQAIC